MDAAAENGRATRRPRATLCKRPKDLYELWNEWELGIHGGVPAKHFSAAERGANKLNFSLRRNFWGKANEMARAGWSSAAAINEIINHYGSHLALTDILKLMRKDKKKNTWPRSFTFDTESTAQ